MSEAILLEKIKQLPNDCKEELYDYLLQLEKKSIKKKSERKAPQFGSLKGVFKMADDFDEPLEDFKEYM